MKYILICLLKIGFFYALLAILYEVFLANQSIYNTQKSTEWVTVTQETLLNTFKNICECEWKNIKLIKLSLQIFQEKIHYLILSLIIIKVYYIFRSHKNKQPRISKTQKILSSQYELQKRRNTQIQLQKLSKSRQFKQYIRTRKQDKKDDQDEQETAAWQQIQRQIYD